MSHRKPLLLVAGVALASLIPMIASAGPVDAPSAAPPTLDAAAHKILYAMDASSTQGYPTSSANTRE